MVARVVLGARADGTKGLWVTNQGFNAMVQQPANAYQISTSDGIGVNSFLASGTFTLAERSSAFYPFPQDFSPFIPLCFIHASAGIGNYELGPPPFIAQVFGLNGITTLTAQSNGVIINNPGNAQAAGVWFAVR